MRYVSCEVCVERAREIGLLRARNLELQSMLDMAKATQLQLEARIAELQAQPAPKVRIVDPCGKRLECGGKCHLAMAHHGYCLCVGDTDGPGTCDA